MEVCPVNCIHPTTEELGYDSAEMLYIDPDACIECGACMDACPVGAIFPSYELPESLMEYEELNARYFEEPGHREYEQVANAPEVREFEGEFSSTLRIAIVGSGPSACYAAEDLLTTKGIDVSVDMFERLPTPFGLVRYGVAPDHQDTKVITDRFSSLFRRKNLRLFLNTEVGRDVTYEQLSERYHAVLYATGAQDSRELGVPGEDLPGSHAAADFVSWYNGHPDFSEHDFNLNTERAVIVGNGNVALDIARLLTADPSIRETSDMADYAIDAIDDSNIKEVIVLGRRGPAEAAFTTPELLGILATDGINLVVSDDDLENADPHDDTAAFKIEVMRRLQAREPEPDNRTILLRFLGSPVEIVGEDFVTGIRVSRNSLTEIDGVMTATPTQEVELIETGLVLRSVGHRSNALAGLPFDESRGIVPNRGGRANTALPVYVTGWIKRGATGVIGTNRRCAAETISALFQDIASGRIVDHDLCDRDDLAVLLPNALDANAWKKLDRYERKAGRDVSRPRRKVTSLAEMLEIALD